MEKMSFQLLGAFITDMMSDLGYDIIGIQI